MPRGYRKNGTKPIPPSRLGSKETEEHKNKISQSLKGKLPKNKIWERKGNKHLGWKGDKVGYYGVHDWIARWKGLPDTCEMCGKTGLTKQQIHWANIDHTYKRVLDDYIRLCASCHKKYDIEYNNLFSK